jgi:hypothetical protein
VFLNIVAPGAPSAEVCLEVSCVELFVMCEPPALQGVPVPVGDSFDHIISVSVEEPFQLPAEMQSWWKTAAKMEVATAKGCSSFSFCLSMLCRCPLIRARVT